ncbi:MAG: hypothetical protein NTX50_11415 [Candidatus Sumerlaeota bacterium]|nr:hypothetical protein [Candidatus Sumerlaeota bacterium]
MDYKLIRAASMATIIPFFLGVGPVAGWLLGSWLGVKAGYPQTGALVGLLMGFLAGVRASYQMTRRVMEEIKNLKR